MYRSGRMVVDLDLCTGCQACIVACFAENNIGVAERRPDCHGAAAGTGSGSSATGRATTPTCRPACCPLICQQCANAPCEPVCPVFASVHSERRPQPPGLQPLHRHPLLRQQLPLQGADVQLLRARVRRAPRAAAQPGRDRAHRRDHGEVHVLRAAHPPGPRRGAGRRAGEVLDGEIQPACVQTCPTGAMVFGDGRPDAARCSRLMQNPRGAPMLESLRTEPSVVYLSRGGAGEWLSRATPSTGDGRRHRRGRTRPARPWRSYQPATEEEMQRADVVLDNRLLRWMNSADARATCCWCCLLGLVVLAGFADLGHPDVQGHRHRRHPPAGLLGFLHHQLRVLDRHQPLGHPGLGHPARAQRRVAAPADAGGRADDRVRPDDRRPLPAHPPGAVVALLLDDALPQRASALAQLPLAAALGHAGHLHLHHGEPPLPVPAAHPRPGRRSATAPAGIRRPHLQDPLARVAGVAAAVEPARTWPCASSPSSSSRSPSRCTPSCPGTSA